MVKSKERVRTSRCREFLKRISIGQYSTKLYYEGGDTYSSAVGGLLTLIYVLFIAVFACVTFYKIFAKESYNLNQNTS